MAETGSELIACCNGLFHGGNEEAQMRADVTGLKGFVYLEASFERARRKRNDRYYGHEHTDRLRTGHPRYQLRRVGSADQIEVERLCVR
jgi:hypothetical protein